MDDKFVIQKEENKQNFLQHISSVYLAMQFTVENNKEGGAIPFLDTIVKPENDGELSITVYRKPTPHRSVIQWDSHHHLSAKYCVISTLTQRAKTVSSNPELLQNEMEHLRKALTNCKYPKWALDKVEKRLTRSTGEVNDGANIQCGDLTCNDEYIGETSRTFGERFKEQLKCPSPIHHHSSNTGHPTTQQNFQIIGREGHGLARNIKESIFIRVNNLTLNKNIGKFNLPLKWDRVLLNTPGLTLKRSAQAVGQANCNEPNIPTHLNQPNILTHLGQPNSPMHIFTGSEHAHRTS